MPDTNTIQPSSDPIATAIAIAHELARHGLEAPKTPKQVMEHAKMVYAIWQTIMNGHANERIE
jgi:hypothetical protein